DHWLESTSPQPPSGPHRMPGWSVWSTAWWCTWTRTPAHTAAKAAATASKAARTLSDNMDTSVRAVAIHVVDNSCSSSCGSFAGRRSACDNAREVVVTVGLLVVGCRAPFTVDSAEEIGVVRQGSEITGRDGGGSALAFGVSVWTFG